MCAAGASLTNPNKKKKGKIKNNKKKKKEEIAHPYKEIETQREREILSMDHHESKD